MPSRLDQVINNVLENATKYTPAGGVIAVSVKREGHECALRIQDTGVGMAPELVPRVFDLFVQGDARSRGVSGGLGIGLAPSTGNRFRARVQCASP